jgi:hypothetical protein
MQTVRNVQIIRLLADFKMNYFVEISKEVTV